HETLLGASQHQHLPLAQIVEAVYPQHDITRVPLVQASFVCHELPSFPALPSDVSVQFLPLVSSPSRQDLSFVCYSSEQSLHLNVIYNSELFASASIERIAQHYHHLLQSFIHHSAEPLSTLSCLTLTEQACLLHDWNTVSLACPPAPDLCIQHL